MTGRVSKFDNKRGVGEIAGADGTAYWFHCTRIADGTRVIDPGTDVEFEVVPGHRGRWEASAITPRA